MNTSVAIGLVVTLVRRPIVPLPIYCDSKCGAFVVYPQRRRFSEERYASLVKRLAPRRDTAAHINADCRTGTSHAVADPAHDNALVVFIFLAGTILKCL